MPFKFTELEIPGVKLIEPAVFSDERGFFMECYNRNDFIERGIGEDFFQDNYSLSSKGVLRGLHYQLSPFAQSKIVRCVRGEIFDVAVDIRLGSPTFGKYVSAMLSEENKKMLYIPRGFAHGFLTLSERADVLYKASSIYNQNYERGIIWDDTDIWIKWPITNGPPILSKKDNAFPILKRADIFDYKGCEK